MWVAKGNERLVNFSNIAEVRLCCTEGKWSVMWREAATGEWHTFRDGLTREQAESIIGVIKQELTNGGEYVFEA